MGERPPHCRATIPSDPSVTRCRTLGPGTAAKPGLASPSASGVRERGGRADRIRDVPHRSHPDRLQIPQSAAGRSVADGQRLLRLVVKRCSCSGRRVRLEPLTVVRRHSLFVVQAALSGPGDARPCRKPRLCARRRGCRAPASRRAERVGRTPSAASPADSGLRDQPDDPVLRGQRYERHALRLSSGDDHPVFPALDPCRRSAAARLRWVSAGTGVPRSLRGARGGRSRGRGCSGCELLAAPRGRHALASWLRRRIPRSSSCRLLRPSSRGQS